MWRPSLATATVALIDRMVLCGITRYPFTIHLRSGAAAVRRVHTGRSHVLSYVRSMRVAIFLTTIFAATVSVIASTTSIVSPDRPQTFAYGEMIWHQLYLERTSGELSARITFSNLPYASDDEPRRDESFDFRFPGSKFDTTQRTFFVSGCGGQTIPVARFRNDPFRGWIDLAPGAKIHLLKKSGRVTAVLTATDYPRAGSQWIETDDNWSLQNLLIALFGQPAPGLP